MVVDRRGDFWETALWLLTEGKFPEKLHCLILTDRKKRQKQHYRFFTKKRISEKLHCLKRENLTQSKGNQEISIVCVQC